MAAGGMVAQQPMYQQIADDLRSKIESGVLAPGQKLPTETQLRDEYNNASRNTVRDAIKRLTSLGLVESRPGTGTFVTQKINPFVTVLGSGHSEDPEAVRSVDPAAASYLSEVSKVHRTARIGRVQVELKPAPAEIALRLRITPGDQVVVRHQDRFIDDIPWSLQTSFYPMEFVTSGKASRLLMAEDIQEGTVSYLKDAMGLRQAGYRDWITARAPDDNEQRFFGISRDSTVFEIFRTGFDQNGVPMRVTVTVCPADRNQFIVTSRTVPDASYEEEGTDLQHRCPAGQAALPVRAVVLAIVALPSTVSPA
jgi:GntR family transcriptional regulator